MRGGVRKIDRERVRVAVPHICDEGGSLPSPSAARTKTGIRTAGKGTSDACIWCSSKVSAKQAALAFKGVACESGFILALCRPVKLES